MPTELRALAESDYHLPPLRRGRARYGLAIAVSLLTLLIRIALHPVVGYDQPLLPFVLPIVISAWLGGFGPGLLTTLLCLTVATYLFIPPIYSLRITNFNDLVRVGVFTVEGLAISAIGRFQNRPSVLRREALLHQQAELLDQSRDAILAWELSGPIRFWNHGAAELYGWSRDEALGQLSHVLLATELPLPHTEFEALLAQERVWSGELIHTTRSGQRIVTESRMTVVPQPNQRLLVLETNRNITARKADEAEQAAQSARLRVLADASRAFVEAGADYRDVVSQIARTTAVHLRTGCLLRMVSSDGRTLDTVASHDEDAEVAAFLLATGADRPLPVDDPQARRLLHPEPVLTPHVIPAQHRDLTPEQQALLTRFTFHSRITVPLRAQGQIAGVMVLSRHRLDAPAFTSDDLELAKDLAERAALAIANARLYASAQAAARTRDSVMAGVSHDLRNPLGVIDGYAKVLRRRLSRPDRLDPAALLEIVGKVEHTTTRMNMLLGDLVDTARLEAGYALTLQLEPTDLERLVQQTIAHYATTTTRHELRFANTAGALRGEYDAPRVERVIGNLLSNAIKYSPSGGTIDILLAEQRDLDGAWAVLTVRDPGLGIPDDDLPHIFEQYHRAANVGTISGTGVGLATSRQIAREHGGELTVASTAGAGSTFTLRLPLPTTTSASAENEALSQA